MEQRWNGLTWTIEYTDNSKKKKPTSELKMGDAKIIQVHKFWGKLLYRNPKAHRDSQVKNSETEKNLVKSKKEIPICYIISFILNFTYTIRNRLNTSVID